MGIISFYSYFVSFLGGSLSSEWAILYVYKKEGRYGEWNDLFEFRNIDISSIAVGVFIYVSGNFFLLICCCEEHVSCGVERKPVSYDVQQ